MKTCQKKQISAEPISSISTIPTDLSTRNLRDLLRQPSYFERCTEVELFALIAKGYRKHFDIDEVICRENEPSEEFYIILSGAVEVFSEKMIRRSPS